MIKYYSDRLITSFGFSLNCFFPNDHCFALEWRRLKICTENMTILSNFRLHSRIDQRFSRERERTKLFLLISSLLISMKSLLSYLLIISVWLNHRHFNFALCNFFTNFLKVTDRTITIILKYVDAQNTWISFRNCSFRRRIISTGICPFPTVPLPIEKWSVKHNTTTESKIHTETV